MDPHLPKNGTQQHHGTPTPSPASVANNIIIPHPEFRMPSFKEHHKNVPQLAMIVMACMVGVIMFLCAVSVLIRYFYSRRYSRNNQNRRVDAPILFDLNGDSPPSSDNDDDVEELAVVHPIWYIRTVGLQQSLIDSITVFKYKKGEGIIDGTECSVCLGEFEHDESLRLLPKCSHAFHIPCIDTWLRSHKNCPLCRAPVLRDETDGAHVIRAVDQSNQTVSNVSGHQEARVESSDHERVEDDDVSSAAVEVVEATQPLRRSVSMDSSSANSMVLFGDVVVDLDTHHCGEKVNYSSNKDMSVVVNEKHGSGSSTSTTIINNKLASIGRALQKRPISVSMRMRRSFSHNTKFLFSRHCRSQSSTLPL